jgi:CubicO group peptidase (beta-lactamase class C family)
VRRAARTGIGIVAAVAAIVAAAPFAGPLAQLPSNAAGMAARGTCSGAFVAGRPWRDVLAQDVLPASAILKAVDVQVDEERREVRARFPGADARVARLVEGRGCVLEATGAAGAAPARTGPAPPFGLAGATRAGSSTGAGPAAGPMPATTSSDRPSPSPSPGRPGAARPPAPARDPAPWPRGDAPLPAADWGPSVDAAALAAAVDAAFEAAGDPAGANARGVAVVHRGRLLVDRGTDAFPPGTPLHGWSMAKTVVAMLAHGLAADGRLTPQARVVDAFPAPRAPAWVAAWRADARASIRVTDLMHMRDGLAQREEYGPLGSVPRMLWGAGGDVAAVAAEAPAEAPPGERWRYLSATTNLLSSVVRAGFERDDDYWAHPRDALFKPIGARTAVLETDASGTWIGSSYLWASAADWARLGWLLASDGAWGEARVLPAGLLAALSRPATGGEGRGYGMQLWRIGDARAGACRDHAVPEDALAMRGHWGQIVAVVPSREAVVVRMGWTFDRSRFDGCAFVARVLAALR